MKRTVFLLNTVIAASLTLVAFSTVAAEDRSAVLERIKPVGSVAVAAQAKPADAAESAPAPAAEKPADAPAPVAEGQPAEAATPAADAPAPVAEGQPAEAAPTPAGGGDVMALATSKGCMACHQVEAKVVGPSYKEVAAKYKGMADAEAKLLAKLKSGGAGTWGPVPMPPQTAVSEGDLTTLIKWVLSM